MTGRLNRFYDSKLVKLSNQLLNEFILFRVNFLMISSKSIDSIYGAKYHQQCKTSVFAIWSFHCVLHCNKWTLKNILLVLDLFWLLIQQTFDKIFIFLEKSHVSVDQYFFKQLSIQLKTPVQLQKLLVPKFYSLTLLLKKNFS